MMLLWITMLCFALVGGAPTGNLKKEPEKREAANVVKPVLVLPRYMSSKSDNYVVLTGRSKNYVLYKAKKNWDDARRACQAIGGDLASIYSGSDEKQLMELITKEKAGETWVGSRRLTKNTPWRWLTGEDIPDNGFKWDNFSIQHRFFGANGCLRLHGDTVNGLCGANACTTQYSYICELM